MEQHIDSGYPKTFVWACEDDDLVPVSNARRMAKALELEEMHVPYKIPEQGIMIETPAAVMVSDELSVSPSMVLKVRKVVRELQIG